MKRWMMTCAAGVMAMGSVVAVSALHGCGSAGSSRVVGHTAPEHETGYSTTRAPNATPSAYGEVPEIDMNAALAESRVGDGADGGYEAGFEQRRAKLNFDGDVDPRDWFYRVRGDALGEPASAARAGAVPLLGDVPLVDSWGTPSIPPPPPPPSSPSKPLNTAPADVRYALPAEPQAAAHAEFALRPGQELWVIERPRGDRFAPRDRNDDFPGSATLMTHIDDPDRPGSGVQRDVPVPLKHTDVHASIAGAISSVRVTQQYHNPFGSKIEALYVFPLPDDAAVNDFVMTIGTRSIRGVIREREQAEQIYEQARSRGYHASLMTQERSNIFTQKVANIEPGQSVDIDITYFHTLGFREGGYEFVFPMVVGPRYNPCRESNGVGAVPVYANGASGQPTEVQYLRPDMRSGTDISVEVDIDAGVPIESIESPTHHIVASIDPGRARHATARLSSGDSIPNRDFVLRYRVSGGQLKAGLITQRDADGRGGFFSLVMVPPSDLRYTTRGPVELVFVMDCSGSMEGEPLRLAKRAVVNALGQLRPEDSFQVIRFSDTCTFMTDRPVAASGDNIRRGIGYVQSLNANGGTEMLKGLEPSLELRGDWDRTRFVCLVSDGLLGNEPEVLGQLKRKLGDSRIFSMGIGAEPNRTLLNAMARIGRGAAGYVANDQDAEDVTNLFIERISSAAMTDLRIDWGDMQVSEVYPKRIPDLYVGRPVVLYGRYRDTAGWARTSDVRVSGRVGRQRETMTIARDASDASCDGKALSLVWARTKITDLDENAGWGGRAVGAGSDEGPNKREIRDLALQYGLLSAYTSLVAVDSWDRTSGNFGTTVAVPVNVPRGVRYDTTVGER